MGIENLWEVLQGAASPRVPFPQFVSQFIHQNGRVPRLAIDLYSFTYRTFNRKDSTQDEATTQAVRDTMAKLSYLISLNITFVVVFDGKLKPNKSPDLSIYLKNFEPKKPPLFEDTLKEFLELPESEYLEQNDICLRLRTIFREYKIDYVEAPAEAEAECARLQKTGIVDYVVTADSDALVFGATAILRSFRKSIEEFTPYHKHGTPRQYYVTPIYLADIEAKYGLDTKKLVLLATLRGGDYSKGSLGIGILRSMQIAQCGTSFIRGPKNNSKKAKNNPNSQIEARPLPDLAEFFVDCFYKHESDPDIKVFDIWGNMRSVAEREDMLARFSRLLNLTVSKQGRDIFGERFNGELSVDAYSAMLYLFPLVTQSLYKFLPISLSFGEFEVVYCDIKVPLDNRYFIESERVPRANVFFDRSGNTKVGYSDLLLSKITGAGSCSILLQSFTPHDEKKYIKKNDHLVTPLSFRPNLKNIVLKLLSQFNKRPELKPFIEVTRQKTIDNEEYLMIKYHLKELAEKYSKERIVDPIEAVDEDSRSPFNSPEREKDNRDYIWIPFQLVMLVNSDLVEEFINRPSPQTSPKKRKKQSPQKTTLDNFGRFPASPTKRRTSNLSSTNERLQPPHGSSTRLNFTDLVDRNEARSSRSSVDSKKSHLPAENEHQSPSAKAVIPQKSPPKRRRSSKNIPLPGQSMITSFYPSSGNPFLESNADKQVEYLSLTDSESDDDAMSILQQTSPTKRKGSKLGKVPMLQHTESLIPPSPTKSRSIKTHDVNLPNLTNESGSEHRHHLDASETVNEQHSQLAKTSNDKADSAAPLSRDIDEEDIETVCSDTSNSPTSSIQQINGKGSFSGGPNNVEYVPTDSDDDEHVSEGQNHSSTLLDRLMQWTDEDSSD